MIKKFQNFDIFFKSVISNKKIFYQNNISISEDLEQKFTNDNNFIFEKKSLFLFKSKGDIIFSEPEILNNEYKDIINNIAIKIGKFSDKNSNKISKNIFFDILFIGGKDKLIFVKIGKIDIIALGVFSIYTKTSLIKLYLLNFLILFINYIEGDVNILSNLDNNIHINIFKEFLFSPFHQYYLLLIKQIYQKKRFKLKNISYKNLYLIELNSNQIIFSHDSLFNNINLWNEILYHCHILENNYMNQYSLNFNEDNFENYFAVFELKSTYPRRTFIIRFLPVLNGLGLIHEFIQDKLSSNDGSENNHYKEYESNYGFLNEIITLSQKTCNSTHSRFVIFKNEPISLKKINNFFIGSLSLNNPQKDLFFWRNHNNIYICKEIMNILNKKNQKNNNYNIIKEIEKELYEGYQKETKIKKDIDLNIYNNNIFYNNGDNFIENISLEKIDLTISKLFILMTLFNNNDKNTSKISRALSSQKELAKFHSSKKGLNKLSDILNENVSENIGSYNFSNNKLLKDNNSFKESNIFDSKNNNLNINNSYEENNLFDINISIIQNNNKGHTRENIDNNRNIVNVQNLNELNINDLDSKNEFMEGEKLNKVK